MIIELNVVLVVTLVHAAPFLSNLSATVNITPELPPSLIWPPNDGYCQKKAKCVSHNATCFGVPLPYAETSTEVVSHLFDSNLANFQYLQQHLSKWESLRRVPKCWQTLQPFLCALYLPKCEQDTVYLQAQERCKFLMSTCSILNESPFREIFPYINCDALEYFPPNCKNDVKDIRSNLSGECVPPLVVFKSVDANDTKSQYDKVNGCALQCEDPLFTKDEHDQIHKMIAFGAVLCIMLNIFTMMTFLIDWPSGRKYPASCIFYINVCFLVLNLAFLAQFLPTAREDIVCTKDLTIRTSEPYSKRNLSCAVVFFIVYYSSTAACMWYFILTYAWHFQVQAFGKMQEKIDKKGAYFHLLAWSVPLVLTTIAMFTTQVDANSVAGICYIQDGMVSRVGFVLAPVTLIVTVGGFFTVKALYFLQRIKRDSQQIYSAQIRRTIFTIGIISFFSVLLVLITIICHIYEFVHKDEWQKSLKDYIFCLILSPKPESVECQMKSRPSVAMAQLHLLTMFSASGIMSCWVLTQSAARTWKRFFNKKICHKEVKEPMKYKKHKLIAQAFAKRKDLNNADVLSLSYHSSHPDPVGLNFELNSMASCLSSNWIDGIQNLVNRRGALVFASSESNSTKRRNSNDSNESYTCNVRQFSFESRRHSLDSQVSMKMSEVTAQIDITGTPRTRHQSGRSKDARKDKRHQNSNRRGSSTSQESQIDFQTLAAYALNYSNMIPQLLKRRQGNAGLESGNDLLNRRIPVSDFDLSDDYHSQDQNGISDEDGSNASDDLCSPGQGPIKIQESEDSDLRSQNSDDEEASRIEEILRREKAFTATESNRNRLKIRDLEYQKKSYKRDGKSRCKSDDYARSVKHGKSRTNDSKSLIQKRKEILDDSYFSHSRNRLKAIGHDRKSRSDREKERKSSNSDFDDSVTFKNRKYRKNSDFNGKKYRIDKPRNRVAIALQKGGNAGNKTNDYAKATDSESEFDEDSRLVRGNDTEIRGDSSRSKRNVTVDVGTQMSTQEMATQTDPNDYSDRSVSRSATSNQGTQVTPPLHIRLINKTLGANGALTERNYSYSSLADQ